VFVQVTIAGSAENWLRLPQRRTQLAARFGGDNSRAASKSEPLRLFRPTTRRPNARRILCPLAVLRSNLGSGSSSIAFHTLKNLIFQKTAKNRHFIETLVRECDIGMLEKLFNKSHRRCHTRLWRPKPRQAESA
jgi:hypothetical protein